MSAHGFVVTPAGAAAFASSQAGQPVAISAMAFGDANGVAYAPTGAEAALRHEVVRVPVDQVVRDPGNANQLIATATLPEAIGGFQILEVAVYLANGQLAAIGPANVYKSQPADGVVTSLTLDAVFAVSPAAQVVVSFNDAALVTQAYVFQHRQFFAVTSATATAPPATPAVEAQYLLPKGCTGAWASQDGQIALWRGAASGWLFITAPFGAQANAADTNLSWLLTTSGWTVKAPGFGAESVKASANVCDLGAAATQTIKITGATNIASFGAAADLDRPLYVGRFTGAPLLSNSAGLQLPGGANIQAAPGDAFLAEYLGGGAWQVLIYQPAAGYDRAGAATAARQGATSDAKTYTDGVAALLAPLLSPQLKGTPLAPTAAPGTANTQIATTAYVMAAIAALIGAAPSMLQTLQAIDAQLANDESAAAALAGVVATKAATADVQTWLAAKLSLAGGSMTGPLSGLHPPQFDRSNLLATMGRAASTGGSYGTVNGWSTANVVLPAAACGCVNVIFGVPVQLPPTDSVPSGTPIDLYLAAAAPQTISTSSGNIFDHVNSGAITLAAGGCARFVSNGWQGAAGRWYPVQISGDYAPIFRSVITSNLGALGASAGSILSAFDYGETDSNGDRFRLNFIRGVAGSNWQNAYAELRRDVDNSGGQAFLRFGDPAYGGASISFGGGSTTAAYAPGDGFVYLPNALARTVNDSRAPTSAWVKSVGARVANFTENTSSTLYGLTADQFSGSHHTNYVRGATLVLPAANTVESHQVGTIYNASVTAMQVAVASGQTGIIAGPGVTGLASITVPPFGTVSLFVDGYWRVQFDPRASDLGPNPDAFFLGMM